MLLHLYLSPIQRQFLQWHFIILHGIHLFLTADTSASGQKLYTVSPFAIFRFKLDHFKVTCKTLFS